MQHQVHSTDAQHGEIGVEAVKHVVLVMVGILSLEQFTLVMLLHILGTLNDESCATHSRVADGVFEGGLHELDHHADNVTRCTELTIVARGSHFAKHILIHVAHSVTVVHVEVVDALNYLGQRARTLDKEGGILHKTAVGTLLALVERLDIDKHVLAHETEHCLGVLVLEHSPAQVVVGHITVGLGIVPRAILESGFAHSNTKGISISLTSALGIVEHFHEEQIGHLFENGY